MTKKGLRITVSESLVNTDITAAELETLSDGSSASGLHAHAVADLSDIATTYLKLDCSNDPLTGTLETSAGRIRNTTRYTTTATAAVTDDVILANTDGGAWTLTLPAGAEGQTYRVINTGSSTNNLTIAPNGAEHLFGVNSNFVLADAETLIITYNADDGWY